MKEQRTEHKEQHVVNPKRQRITARQNLSDFGKVSERSTRIPRVAGCRSDVYSPGVKSRAPLVVVNASAAKQVAAFIDKFDLNVAKVIRKCRTELRKLLPTSIELVYDNYNFFVIGYAATERASDCVVSIAAASNGVGLSFYQGASLPDPGKILLGTGKQNRFVRLPTDEPLRSPEVLTLIRAAVANAKTPLPTKGGGYTVIKSISAKQRPRRKSN